MTTPPDPVAMLRSKSYLVLLVLAAIVGVPVSAAAYFFLALVSKLDPVVDLRRRWPAGTAGGWLAGCCFKTSYMLAC
jgi:hypothetical protein